MKTSPSLSLAKQVLRNPTLPQQHIKPNSSLKDPMRDFETPLKLCDSMGSKGGHISYSDITKKHSQIIPNILHKNVDLESKSDITLYQNNYGSKENDCAQYAALKPPLMKNENLCANSNENLGQDNN